MKAAGHAAFAMLATDAEVGRGRKWKVEALHKSAVALLTAFWEGSARILAAEALDHLVKHAPCAADLPSELRKLVAKELQDDRHDLAVWQLADDGWRNVSSSRLSRLQQERNKRLNTPKTTQIDELFKGAVGVADISKTWYWASMKAEDAAKKLDTFVTLRGEIAHRGSAATSATNFQVKDYYNHVRRLTGRTETRVASSIETSTGVALWS